MSKTIHDLPSKEVDLTDEIEVQAADGSASGRITVANITQFSAGIYNTDGNLGRMIYVGSVDPTTIEGVTMVDGDIWIETPAPVL